MNLNKATKSAKGDNIITPKVLIVYPALFEATLPPNEKDESKKRFNVTLLVPKSADIALMREEVASIAKEEFGEKAKKAKMPFLDTEDIDSLSEYAEDFPVTIRCAAKFQPDIVSPDGQRTFTKDKDDDQVYGGRWARVSIRPYAWKHATGGLGVSFGLQNIQMLDHDDPIAGARVRGTDEFEAVSEEELEGAFE
jgi:hypothetical protein